MSLFEVEAEVESDPTPTQVIQRYATVSDIAGAIRMTEAQLVEMDRLLVISPDDALVISPDGQPWAAPVTRYVTARHPWDRDLVSLIVPMALLLTWKSNFHVHWWDGAMISWGGRWFAATLVGTTPSQWYIANEYLATFGLTPSAAGPCLTPRTP